MPSSNFYDVDIKAGYTTTNDFYIEYLSKKIGNKDFLDIGCNSGYLLEKCGHGTGVDLSFDLINKAKAKGLDVYFEDAGNTHFADRTFPIVVLSCILQQNEKPFLILEEALRVCKEKVIGITPLPNKSIWGVVGGNAWVKSVIEPETLKGIYKAEIEIITEHDYYFEVQRNWRQVKPSPLAFSRKGAKEE